MKWKHYSIKIVPKHKNLHSLRVFGGHSRNHFKTFKNSGILSKVRNLGFPYEYKPRVVARRFCKIEMLLEHYKKNRLSIGLCLVIRNGSIIMPRKCSIQWDQKAVPYQLLKPSEIINEEFFREQIIQLKRPFAEKRPEFATRLEAICCKTG